MANDKKNDKSILGRTQEVMASLREKASTPTMAEFDVAAKIASNEAELDKIANSVEKLTDQRLLLLDKINKENEALRDLSKILLERRITGAEKFFQTSMRTAVGTRQTKEDISRYAHSAEQFGAILSLKEQSSGQLERRQQKLGSSIEIKRQEILEAKQEPLFDQEKLERLTAEFEQMKLEQGQVTGALAYQKKMGTDTKSVYTEASLLAKKFEETAFEEQSRVTVRSDKTRTSAKIKEELDAEAKKFKDALDKLTQAIESNADDIDAHKKVVEESTAKIKELEIQKDELRKQGWDRPGGRGMWGVPVKDLIGTGGAALQAGSNIFSQWAIGVPKDELKLHAALMGIANQNFDDARAAAKGDVAALRRLQASSESVRFAQSMRGRQVVAETVGVAGSIATTGAQAAEGFARGAMTGSAVAGGVAAVGAAAQGVTQVSGQAARLSSGAATTEQFVDSYSLRQANQAAIDYQSVVQQQTALDYFRQTYAATAGMGRRASGTLARIRDQQYVDRMASQYGIGLQDIAQFQQAGARALGSQYDPGQLEGAARAYRARLVESTGEYAGLLGTTRALGGKDAELERTLRQAVAAGMDSSKNIGEIMKGIGDMASAQSSGGMSVYTGAESRMMASIQALKAAGVEGTLATTAARNIAMRQNEIVQNRGETIEDYALSYDLLKMGIRPGTPEGEAVARMNATKARQATAILSGQVKKQIFSGATRSGKIDVDFSPEERLDEIRRMGLGALVVEDKDIEISVRKTMERIAQANRAVSKKTLRGDAKSVYWGTPEQSRNLEDVWNQLYEGKTPEQLGKAYKEAEATYNTFLSAQGKPTQASFAAVVAGLRTGNRLPEDELRAMRDTGADIDKTSAQSEAKLLSEGMRSLGGDIGKLVDQMKNTVGMLDSGNFDTLRKSTNDLSVATDALAGTVRALNMRLLGDNEGAMRALDAVKKQANIDQQRSGVNERGAMGL
jgi:hypothetical protein